MILLNFLLLCFILFFVFQGRHSDGTLRVALTLLAVNAFLLGMSYSFQSYQHNAELEAQARSPLTCASARALASTLCDCEMTCKK